MSNSTKSCLQALAFWRRWATSTTVLIGCMVSPSAEADLVFGESELKKVVQQLESSRCQVRCETSDWMLERITAPKGAAQMLAATDAVFFVRGKFPIYCGASRCVEAYLLRDDQRLTILRGGYDISAISPLSARDIPAMAARQALPGLLRSAAKAGNAGGPRSPVQSSNLPAAHGVASNSTAFSAAGANTRSSEADCGPLSPARQAIVRDILSSYRSNLRAIEQVASHADEAVLAWAAYGGEDAIELARQRGWSEHPRSRNGGFVVLSTLGGGDAVARLFVSEQGEAILAFRGTTTKSDWLTNAGTVLPVYSDQLRSARQLADSARALYPKVAFVGHSLGGAMAQVARFHTGLQAVIFNSAPIGLHALGMAVSGKPLPTRGSASLRAFRSPEDPVRAAAQGLVDFEDVVVGNIVPTNNTVFQNVLEGLFATGYAHSMPVLARAMQDARMVRDEGWIDAYDCHQRRQLSTVAGAPMLPLALDGAQGVSNSTEAVIAKPSSETFPSVSESTRSDRPITRTDSGGQAIQSPSPGGSTILGRFSWEADPRIVKALLDIRTRLPSGSDTFCKALNGPLQAADRKVLFEDTILKIRESGREYQLPVDHIMLSDNRFCTDSENYCRLSSPQVYYCASGESKFFTTNKKSIFEVSYAAVSPSVREHVRKPMGDKNGQPIPVEGTSCHIKTPWPEPDRARWTGTCIDGKISGVGSIQWMKGAAVIWHTKVGQVWGVSIENNELYFDLDLNRFRFSLAQCGRERKYRAAAVVAKSKISREFFANVWISEEILARGASFLKDRCGNEGNDYSNIRVSISDEAAASQYASIVSARNASPGKLSWQNVENSASSDLRNKIEQEERRRSDNELQAARNQRSQHIDAQRRAREAQWNEYWERTLSSNSAWPNIADLMIYSKARTMAKLVQGHLIKIVVEDVAFSAGRAYVTARQTRTRIYADLPEREFTWDQFAEGLRKSSDIQGYAIRCSIDQNSLGRYKAGESYELYARLDSVGTHGGFLLDRIDLDCQ